MVDNESGEVDRDTIIRVLRFHGIDVSQDYKEAGNYLLVRGATVQSIPIEDWSKRRFVHFLQRTFTIPIHHFYRPEMMGGDSGKPM